MPFDFIVLTLAVAFILSVPATTNDLRGPRPNKAYYRPKIYPVSYREETDSLEHRDGWLPVGATDRRHRQQAGGSGAYGSNPGFNRPPQIVQEQTDGQTHVGRYVPKVSTNAAGDTVHITFGGGEPRQRAPPPKVRGGQPIRHKDYEIREEDIISLPVGKFPEPTCKYSVLKDRVDGPEATTQQVNIGDRLYHRWRCFPTNTAPNLYCISVTSCNVTAGSLSAPLIDNRGCSLEPQILPHVTYNPNDKLDAWIEAHAFRLIGSEQTVMNFHCQINILIKENGRCPRYQCPPL